MVVVCLLNRAFQGFELGAVFLEQSEEVLLAGIVGGVCCNFLLFLIDEVPLSCSILFHGTEGLFNRLQESLVGIPVIGRSFGFVYFIFNLLLEVFVLF